jgi:LCP family protein required for cell wall assembly
MAEGSSPRGPARKAARGRPKLRNQLLFFLGILVLAGGAFYTALIVTSQVDHIFFPGREITFGGIDLPGVDSEGVSSGDISGRRINILVMGIDKRDNEQASNSRTDTMFVVTIDPATSTARGLGLPRDLWVEIPAPDGTYEQRINTAYNAGEDIEEGGGPSLARATVENLLGIKIDHHVIIDFAGFKEIIDLLGGIDVEVSTPVDDPFYSETELLGDFYPCIFDVGVHHMNGSDALCYARTRRQSDDFDRIQRQQRVIFAVLERAAQLDILDPGRIVELYKNYKDTVDTDISDFQIGGYAALASRVGLDSLAFLTLAPVTVPYTTPEGAAVLIPSEEGIDQMVAALLSDPRLIQEAAVVEVQNGTPVEGQATAVKEYLGSLGIPETSLYAESAANNGYLKTEIIDFSGKPYTAERIAEWLGVSIDQVRTATAADATLLVNGADILVILGPDAEIEASTLANR